MVYAVPNFEKGEGKILFLSKSPVIQSGMARGVLISIT